MVFLKRVWAAIVGLWRRLTQQAPPEQKLRATIIDRLPGPEPGVGVCLSGGGSRALTAALGQLRGLAHLEVDGKPLLGQVTALSTVSGGSWLGVPWLHLTPGTSDSDYLNGYVGDPGRLVLTETPGHSGPETLDHLPPGNPGRNIGGAIAIEDLVVQMIGLRLWHGTPWNMMWQVLIARHLLHPYGLYESGYEAMPTSLFSFDEATLANDVVGPNPRLADIDAHLVASGPGRLDRPFMICNTSMFVKFGDEQFEYLAPVQATSRFTGIVSSPGGVDANGRPPGGGGVTSFAFSSDLCTVDGTRVEVDQRRQWALTDIVGASSAAFAEKLQNLFAEAKSDPESLHAEFVAKRSSVIEQLQNHEPPSKHPAVERQLEDATLEVIRDLLRDLDPTELIPRYQYWPVRDARAEPEVVPTRFADGGSLENTGVAAMLSYEQVHSIIAFVNADEPLSVDERGVVKVTDQLPVLFGYRPYDVKHGYRLFADATSADLADLGDARIFRHNQVFESSGFQLLLDGLRDASGDHTSTWPAIFEQTLRTVDNEWFGVKGGRSVTVVWHKLGPVATWSDQLSPAVRDAVDDLDGFPNYSTFETRLDALRVNAMSNLTAWSVANEHNRDTFIDLFR